MPKRIAPTRSNSREGTRLLKEQVDKIKTQCRYKK
jgi:hypothetical protein